jgi:hypothetical protein
MGGPSWGAVGAGWELGFGIENGRDSRELRIEIEVF